MTDPTDFLSLNRRETPEDEQLALDALAEAWEFVEELNAAFDSWEVMPGTAFAGDDRATPYEPLSHQIRSNWNVAFDNLRTVRLVLSSGQTPIFAHFGLVRNAIEAIGVALWTLGPSSRDDRLIRVLRVSLEDRKDAHSLRMVHTGVAREDATFPEDDAVRRRLEQIRDDRPGLRNESLRIESITDRLTQAQAYVGEFDSSILFIWKLTSGFAHGRRSTMRAVLDRQILTMDSLGVTMRLTSNLGVLAGLYKSTVHYLVELLSIVNSRNGRPLDLTQIRDRTNFHLSISEPFQATTGDGEQ